MRYLLCVMETERDKKKQHTNQPIFFRSFAFTQCFFLFPWLILFWFMHQRLLLYFRLVFNWNCFLIELFQSFALLFWNAFTENFKTTVHIFFNIHTFQYQKWSITNFLPNQPISTIFQTTYTLFAYILTEWISKRPC